MAERDKWGRIPATLIEVDQDMCALTYASGKCRAGAVANLIPFSGELEDAFWQTDGTITLAGARDGVSDSVCWTATV